MQVPPAYSAKRSGGERLYDLARRGVAVERVPVRVVVYALDVRRVDGAEVEMECAARPGPTCARSPAIWANGWARAPISWPAPHSAAGRSGEAAVGWDDVPVRGREALVPMARCSRTSRP